MGSYDTAVRITLGSGDIDFTGNEIRLCPHEYQQSFQILEAQSGPPVLITEGDEWQRVTLEIIETDGGTRDKIESVIEEEAELTIYPRYAADNSESFSAIHIVDGYLKTYEYNCGERAGSVVHKLTFIKSS